MTIEFTFFKILQIRTRATHRSASQASRKPEKQCSRIISRRMCDKEGKTTFFTVVSLWIRLEKLRR